MPLFVWPPAQKGTLTPSGTGTGLLPGPDSSSYMWHLPFNANTGQYHTGFYHPVDGDVNSRVAVRIAAAPPSDGSWASAGSASSTATATNFNYPPSFSSTYSSAFNSTAYIIRENTSGQYHLHVNNGTGRPITTIVGPLNQLKSASWAVHELADKVHVVMSYGFQTGSSMGSPVYATRIFLATWTISTSIMTTPAAFFTAEAGSVDWHVLLDAGEGYYYLVYSIAGFTYVRGVDFTAATITATAPLGGSGSSYAFSVHDTTPIQRTYITVGSTRYLYVLGASDVLRISYTSGAKATPTLTTITTGAALSKSTAAYSLEFSPGGTAVYLVRGQAYGNASPSINFSWDLAYLDLSIAPVWSATAVNALIAYAQPGAQSTGVDSTWCASAQIGEPAYSIFGATAYGSFQQPSSAAAFFTVWHEPVAFERTVAVGTGYSSVTSGRLITKVSGVTVSSIYDSVILDGAVGLGSVATYRWYIGENSDVLSGVTVGTGYSSVSIDGVEFSTMTVELVQHWQNMGYTYMDEFMVYVNADRAAVGRPPVKTWGEDGKYLNHVDIGNMHATNLARTPEWAHDSITLPPGQQTMLERIDLMPASGGGENNQAGFAFRFSTQTYYTLQTPYELWLNWHNSPGHYANMVRDWGDKEDKVYSVLSMCKGLMAPALLAMDPSWADYEAMYFVNIFVILEDRMYESPLNQTWDNAGAVIAELNQAWSNSAYEHVAVRHSVDYALRIAVQHSVDWGCRVGAEHTAPITYRAGAEHTAAYAATVPVTAVQHIGNYAIKSTTQVLREHDSPWGLSVGAHHQADYSALVTVKSYCTSPYGDLIPVTKEWTAPYSMLVNNRVLAVSTSPYSMLDATVQLDGYAPVAMTLQNGTTLAVFDGVLDSSSSDVGYRFECAIAEVHVFQQIEEGQTLVVDFAGELYSLIVDSKSMDRGGPAKVSMRITANSPVARLGSPYAPDIAYEQGDAALVTELIDGLIEIDFNYEAVDWVVYEGRLQATEATPLDIVGQLAEASGAVVDGTIDGEMRIRYRYPVAMNALDSVTPDHYYTDEYDNLSVRVASEFRDGANAFRVREGEADFSDTLEWVVDEKQTDPVYQTGVLKAYLSPFRDTAYIRHVGGAAYMTDIGVQAEELVEIVEFTKGTGSVGKPVDTLLSVEWVTQSLGSPTFSPFSTTLNVGTSVNDGYGLAKITYNTKHLTAKAGGVPYSVPSGEVGPASSYAYFVLEDTNG